MIKIYKDIISIVFNGKEVKYSYSLPYFEDENKIEEQKLSFNLTWDNIEEVVYKYGLSLPFNLYKIKNNYRIEFFSGYGLIDTFNCRVIKQKKVKELNIQILFTSKEKALKSVNEDFKRCSDIWIDKEVEYETKDYICYSFTLLSGCMKIRTSVIIYLTFIQ